jgi:hypothetical protein
MKKQKNIKILVKTISKKIINGNSNFLDKVWLSVNSSIIDDNQNNSIVKIWSNI